MMSRRTLSVHQTGPHFLQGGTPSDQDSPQTKDKLECLYLQQDLAVCPKMKLHLPRLHLLLATKQVRLQSYFHIIIAIYTAITNIN